MAQVPLVLLMTCLIVIVLISSSTSSSHHHSQLLHVSSSLRLTRQVFELPSPSHPTTSIYENNLTSNSLSLSLHPRSSLPSNLVDFKNNYTALVLSRLINDEARFEAPLFSGLRQGSGEYFARVGLGRPARDFSLVIDTGSDVTWLQCRPCSRCYPQSDPLFDPRQSSTYSALPCSSKQCRSLRASACRAGACLYAVSYSDGSHTAGAFAAETVSFGIRSADVAIGCGTDNGGLFAGAAGLIGLGGGPLSLPSQIRATSFSYCLVNRDSGSSSTLDFNSARPDDSVVAPLVFNPRESTFRYVGLAGISVAGKPVNIPAGLFGLGRDGSGGVIVDSGTSVTRLRAEVYRSLRDAFARATRGLPRAGGFSLLDTCYDLSGRASVRVPTVSFRFSGGGTLALSPESYLIPVDDAGKFCFAFAGTSGELSIIGNVQQQGTRVTYDLANKYIAFSPNKC